MLLIEYFLSSNTLANEISLSVSRNPRFVLWRLTAPRNGDFVCRLEGSTTGLSNYRYTAFNAF